MKSLMKKYRPEHIGASVYCSKHGKGIIIDVKDGAVSVEHVDTYARYRAVDGKGASGKVLHFFSRRDIDERGI